MGTRSWSVNRTLAVLVVGLLAVAVLQGYAAAAMGDDSTQLLVIGLASMTIMLLIGVLVWILRVGGAG